MKKYIAKTNVSVNVVLASGKNLHVSFSPLTGVGSVYYTELPEVQKALESHYKYGRLFRLDPTYAPEKPRAAKPGKKAPKPDPEPITTTEAPAGPGSDENPAEPTDYNKVGKEGIVGEATNSEDAIEEVSEEIEEAAEESEEESEGNVVVVNDPDEAKDYLCEKFGYSRTKIKGLKSIKAAAAQSGVIFKGLD